MAGVSHSVDARGDALLSSTDRRQPNLSQAVVPLFLLVHFLLSLGTLQEIVGGHVFHNQQFYYHHNQTDKIKQCLELSPCVHANCHFWHKLIVDCGCKSRGNIQMSDIE